VNYKDVGTNEIIVGEKLIVDGTNEIIVGEKLIVDVVNKLIDSFQKLRLDSKEGLKKLLISIIQNEGKKIENYMFSSNVSKRTLERYIKILRENNIVEFIGEAKAKNSGYFLTEDFKKKIKLN
ncbi:MAG: hypothetical protein ACK4IX_17245, partial [Candidatus Sericytochromatia bacterium]